jgi:hypothetical protein
MDNDCDMQVDEDCCSPGSMEGCYTGDPSTAGIGPCITGTRTCASDGMFGPCEGEVTPLPEVCDAIDNDCNGTADDAIADVTCGLGACTVTVLGCDQGMTVPCVPLTPAPVEACDGTDDNCDGTVDEGCTCVDGQTQSCYTGSPTTLGVGECKEGVQTCAGGMWSACMGDVTPANEVCDGKDNDCNGQTDENMGTETCGAGICQVTTDVCVFGVPQVCTPGQPQPEVCNGIDDNCNVIIDDGLGAITCGVGECYVNTPACIAGMPQMCTPGSPSAEICDSKDNDCDGSTDEGNPGGGMACMTGQQGVCAAGTITCVNGSLSCVANVMPSAEICDAKDNDCDGSTDEMNPGGSMACNTGQQGVCAAGTTNCQGGQIVCTQNTMPSTEICDGFDNDCDGAADEMNPGGGMTCSTGKLGVCGPGTTACMSGAIVCNQNVQSSPEVCDAKDNDCDGSTDEMNPGGGMACNTGQQGVCAQGTTACTNGAIVCNQNMMSSPETCDAKDNDCDGATDEGTGGQSCSTGQPGVCGPGTTTCTSGTLTCVPNVPPTNEICDSKDNNCNGQTDEGNPGGGQACMTGQLGVCGAGTTSCVMGVLVCNQTTPSSTEICDAKDNNCNGSTDEMNPSVCGTQYPSAQYVTTWACTGGGCQIVTCTSGHANMNGAVSDGCECTTDAWANTCAAAGTLSVAIGATVPMTGIIETASGSDWITFNFTDKPVGQNFHPKVELTNSAGGVYAMDVMTTCSAVATCEAGTGAQTVTWEQNYNEYVAGPSCCSDATPHATSVKVRVYRKNGDMPSCVSYTVTATNP